MTLALLSVDLATVRARTLMEKGPGPDSLTTLKLSQSLVAA